MQNCLLLHENLGTYEEVSRRTQLDRGTVFMTIEQGRESVSHFLDQASRGGVSQRKRLSSLGHSGQTRGISRELKIQIRISSGIPSLRKSLNL